MKHLYLVLSLFLVAITQGQTTQDTLYVWKAGNLVIKQSIKPVDIDSITFKRPVVNIPQVTICTQVWATKNLDVTTYSDGTLIPQVTDPTAWANLTTGAWCYYSNDAGNNATYGKLYNWYAAVGIYDAASLANATLRKKLAPTGWHVPTDAEWSSIINCLDPTADGGWNYLNVAGGKMKETGTTHWNSPNQDASNSSGFSGLPGGCRYYDGSFDSIGYVSYWWSSSVISAFNTTEAWYRVLKNYDGDAHGNFYNKEAGFSVRCLRD
jgi:uncharacterized protein (TIGR02145 family)